MSDATDPPTPAPTGASAAQRRLGAGLVFLGVAALSLWRSGGPISWDELLYIDQSLHTTPAPFILNRYFHIYLQKIFLAIAGDPLSGVRLYWSVLIGWCAMFTYLVAFRLSNARPAACGAAAVIFFMAQRLVLRNSGVTYADTTVMSVMIAGVYVFLLAARSKPPVRGWLLLFGVLVVAAVKSKETGVCLAALIGGLVGLSDSPTDWRDFGRSLGWVALGGLFGSVGLAVADWAMLGDPLFAWRPSNISQLARFNFGEIERYDENWIGYLLGSPEVAPLIFLSIFIAVRRSDRLYAAVSLAPLATVAFLTLSMGGGRWGVIPRYVTPALPVLCALAAQIVSLAPHSEFSKPTLRRWSVALAPPLVIGALGAGLWLGVGGASGWGAIAFFKSILFPLFALGLAISLVAAPQRISLERAAALGLWLLMILGPYLAMIPDRSAQARVEERFSPLTAQRNRMNLDRKALNCIDADFCETPERCRLLFVFAFNRNWSVDRFVTEGVDRAIAEGRCDQAWIGADSLAQSEESIRSFYEWIEDERRGRVFLKRKGDPR